MRTEELLQQSQGLTQELQSQSRELTVQQDELKRSNAALGKQALELEEKASLLAEQNAKVEEKNREVEQARVSLEEKAEQLALASKYKSEFLANMSHELRTPLNSLLVLARLLSENTDGNLTDKQVQFASTICSSGGDLLSLINEILDLSKVEAGKMQIEPMTVPLSEVHDFVERSFRPVAEQKGLAFEVEIEAGVPAAIRTDPQRLQQVLKNLLSNACKFTDVGRVALRVAKAAHDARFDSSALTRAATVVAFHVVDTGIGIPQPKQKVIFEAFQQADGTTNRRYGGTGLGLSISREIARLLGGEIHVSSHPGRGSTFTLYLPDTCPMPTGVAVTAGDETSPPSSAAEQAPSFAPRDAKEVYKAIAGKKVLIIDDDVRNIFAMSSALESKGLRVVYAENGKAGIELLGKTPDVDLVLVDVMMPEMDGYETISAIRNELERSTLPIIAVTAKALKEDRAKCMSAGASDYLPKPIDVDKLYELVARWTAAPAS
jgi:signal transduction histidine kinase/ActR/RegA family two-component response regulator